jgi:hypothetical protein
VDASVVDAIGTIGQTKGRLDLDSLVLCRGQYKIAEVATASASMSNEKGKKLVGLNCVC